MHITDLVVLACAIVLIFRGSSQGFVRSLIGPVALIIGTILGIIAFQITHNFVLGLCVSLFSPMLIGWLLSGALLLWVVPANWTPNVFSQIAGAVITLIWGLVFIFMILIALAIVPPVNTFMTQAHDDIVNSVCYSAVRPIFNAVIPPPPASSASNEQTLQAIQQDPRFLAVEQDPDIQRYISQKNYPALMAHPKIIKLMEEVMKDPQLMQKLMQMSQAKSQPAH